MIMNIEAALLSFAFSAIVPYTVTMSHSCTDEVEVSHECFAVLIKNVEGKGVG
jgi:hypothetical protein